MKKIMILRALANVWKWDWTTVSDSEEVEAIMSGFAEIDESCSS
jgi:hypothetical protein